MTIVDRGRDGYPDTLLRLADPPERLHVRGRLPDAPAIAVVGSRRCTRYGASLARTMARSIGDAGWTVVSGLARGIDTAAHLGALDAGARTVAVLGCGIDRWYPASNRQLGESILVDGAVVSEYGPGTEPAPWRFPARNRIIVGLVSAVIVVEAAERSGALITARLAMEYGVDLFAVPGDLDRETSRGTNRLISDGAHPIVAAGEVVEALERVVGPAGPRPHRLAPLLDGPMFVHEIAASLDLTIGEAARRIGEWELAGLVRLVGGMVEPVR
ncbi:MAG TPA: DNA-processing protein DprA [Acidimicrobiia bacterium]|nr:DNA-processing protein DprA [Acidimicrobiia bacterium]